MSLNWNWSDKVGTLEAMTRVYDGEKLVEKPHTFNVYQGNAMLIFIDEYEQDGRKMYSLYNFFADEQHFKNCLGLNKKQGYTENHLADDGWIKLRINTKKYYPARGFRPTVGKMCDMLMENMPGLTIELYAE